MVTGLTPFTGPVVVAINQTVSIQCRANNTDSPGTLQDLNWLYNNGTRIQPVVEAGEMNEPDVYVERVAGQNGSDYIVDWVRVLHFKRILPSSAGIYACAAHYGGVSRAHRMVIQVSGVWIYNC